MPSSAPALNGPIDTPTPTYDPGDIPPWELPPVEAYQSEWDGQLMSGATLSEVASIPSASTVAEPSLPHATVATREASSRAVASVPSHTAGAARLGVSAAQSLSDTDARWGSNDLLTGCGDAWGELIADCCLGGRLRQLALHAARRIDGRRWVLTLPSEQRHLLSDKALQTLSETFSAHLQQEVKVEVELGQPGLTPAQIEQQRYAQLRVEAEQELAQDPHIQFLIQRFGAQLDADSILPLKH